MASVHNTFGILEDVCNKTFGPSGVGALLETSSGFLTITRSGWAIIKCIRDKNKEKLLSEIILLRNAEKVQKILGDGVKSFVLLEIAFLKYLKLIQMEGQLMNSSICKELNHLLGNISEIVAKNNEHSFLRREDCLKATSALFYTSCHETTSFFLHNAFHKWFHESLSSLITEEENANPAPLVQFLIKRFNTLCLRKNSAGPSTDSGVYQGYLVDRVALNFTNTEEHVLPILYNQSEKANDADISCEIQLLLSENSTNVGFRKMLITSTVFPERLLFDLIMKNIIVLHGVRKEDIDLISTVLAAKYHKVTNDLRVKFCLVGNTKYTCLLFPSVYQLVICAPTIALANEYSSICRRALRLMYAITSFPFGCELISGGGSFERALHFHIAQEINEVNNPLMSNISDRKALILWHQQNQLRKNLSSADQIRDVKSNQEVPTSFSRTKPIESSKPMGKMLCIHKKENLSIPSFHNVDKNVLTAFIRALSEICNHPGYENSSEVFEPVATKILMLQYVIISAIQTLKSDQFSSINFNS